MNYKINDQFQAADLGKVLLGEQGVFEAVSPNGLRLRVEAKPGHSITSLTCPENPGNWNITKIAELTNAQQARAAGSGA